eukprot:11216295-Lingulodinium_polyedra.AAC.1
MTQSPAWPPWNGRLLQRRWRLLRGVAGQLASTWRVGLVRVSCENAHATADVPNGLGLAVGDSHTTGSPHRRAHTYA